MLTLEFPPYIYGGAGVHVGNLTEALRKRMDVCVRACGPTDTAAPKDTHFYPMPKRYSGSSFDKVLNTMVLGADIAHDPIDADLIHSHTWYMAHAAKLMKVLHSRPVVSTVHSLEPHRPWKREQLGQGYDLSTALERELYTSVADAIIAVSESTKSDLLNVYPDVDPDIVEVIPNGVDTSRFRPNPDRKPLEELGIEGNYILFLGRLSRQKGIFDLLGAVEQGLIEENVVLVTGAADTAELKADMEKRVSRLPTVKWIDRMLDPYTIRSLYTHASVFLCPSRYEPFGIINLEAMACGAPVVAASVGGIPEVVSHGKTGLLYEPGDLDAMARTVSRVQSNGKLREKFITNGMADVKERFSWEKVAEKTMGLYRRVLER